MSAAINVPPVFDFINLFIATLGLRVLIQSLRDLLSQTFHGLYVLRQLSPYCFQFYNLRNPIAHSVIFWTHFLLVVRLQGS